jgi:hypothetical protein
MSGLHPALSKPILDACDIRDVLIDYHNVLHRIEANMDLFLIHVQSMSKRLAEVESLIKIGNTYEEEATPVDSVVALNDKEPHKTVG